MKRVVVISLILLAACGYPRSPDGRVLVEDDKGGVISEYEKERVKLASDPSGVVLCGEIESAATIFVSLPNACSCPDAVFNFHGATKGFQQSPKGTAVMASYYPEPLRSWYLRNAAHLMLSEHATLTARQLAAMGILKSC